MSTNTHAGYCDFWSGNGCDCGYNERLEERVQAIEATIARLIEQDETHYIDAPGSDTVSGQNTCCPLEQNSRRSWTRSVGLARPPP